MAQIKYTARHVTTVPDTGEGNWGVQLAQPTDNVAWLSPMLGDGGSSPDMVEALTYLHKEYSQLIENGTADAEDGPDDILIRTIGGYIVLEVAIVD